MLSEASSPTHLAPLHRIVRHHYHRSGRAADERGATRHPNLVDAVMESMKNVMGEGKEKLRSLRRALCEVPLVPPRGVTSAGRQGAQATAVSLAWLFITGTFVPYEGC